MAQAANNLPVNSWHFLKVVVGQLSSGNLSHRIEGAPQPLVIKIGIKDDQMHVSGHDDKSIDPQEFVWVTEIEAVCDGEARFSRDKHRQPIDYRP